MALNELADAAHLYITNFAMETLLLMQNLWYAGQALIAFFSLFYGIAARMRDAKTFGITPSKTTAAASRVTVAPCKESNRMRSIGSATASDGVSTKIAFNTRR
jgi:hypothetical protein